MARYVEEVAAGSEVIIGKAGKPMARLVPYQPEGRPRVGGQLQGRVVESVDCWAPDDDVFDRLLVAQAGAEGLVLASRDGFMAGYGVPVLRA